MGYQDTFGDRLLKFLGWKPAQEGVHRWREYTDIVGTNPDGTENREDLYLRRYYLYRGRHRPHIYLHHIIRSDYDRACHDHPWDFTSLILKGGYREFNEQVLAGAHFKYTQNGVSTNIVTINGVLYRDTSDGWSITTSRELQPGDLVKHSCTDLHRLELTQPAWTLVFTGPRKRDWGFYTHDKGWIPWRALFEYVRDMMP